MFYPNAKIDRLAISVRDWLTAPIERCRRNVGFVLSQGMGMKQLFVAVLATAVLGLVSGGNGHAAPKATPGKLIKLYDNRHGIPVYFVRDSLYIGDDFIQIDTLSDSAAYDPSPGKSSTSLMRFRCKKKEFSAVDIVFYPQPGGKGRAMERLLNRDATFRPVERGSEQELMLRVACTL